MPPSARLPLRRSPPTAVSKRRGAERRGRRVWRTEAVRLSAGRGFSRAGDLKSPTARAVPAGPPRSSRQRVAHLFDQDAVGVPGLGRQAARAVQVPFPGHRLAHHGRGRAGREDVAPPRAEAATPSDTNRRQVVGTVDHHHGRQRSRGLDPYVAERGVDPVPAVYPDAHGGAGHDLAPTREHHLVEQGSLRTSHAEDSGARVHHHLPSLLGQLEGSRRRGVGSGRAVGHQGVDGAAPRFDRCGEHGEDPLDGGGRVLPARVPARERVELGRHGPARRVQNGERPRVADSQSARQRHAGAQDFSRAGHAGRLADGEGDPGRNAFCGSSWDDGSRRAECGQGGALRSLRRAGGTEKDRQEGEREQLHGDGAGCEIRTKAEEFRQGE